MAIILGTYLANALGGPLVGSDRWGAGRPAWPVLLLRPNRHWQAARATPIPRWGYSSATLAGSLMQDVEAWVMPVLFTLRQALGRPWSSCSRCRPRASIIYRCGEAAFSGVVFSCVAWLVASEAAHVMCSTERRSLGVRGGPIGTGALDCAQIA